MSSPDGEDDVWELLGYGEYWMTLISKVFEHWLKLESLLT
jgi:hypothetical protein